MLLLWLVCLFFIDGFCSKDGNGNVNGIDIQMGKKNDPKGLTVRKKNGGKLLLNALCFCHYEPLKTR